MNLSFSCVGTLVDDFWVVRYSIFGDDYRVNRDCGLRQNQESTREAILVMIFQLAKTHCQWRFSSHLGLCAQTHPDVRCGGSLVDDFWVVSYSVFGDDYRVNRDCARRRNQASAVEEVSLMISESAATLFSLSISESTRYLWADKSRRHLLR